MVVHVVVLLLYGCTEYTPFSFDFTKLLTAFGGGSGGGGNLRVSVKLHNQMDV
jgi:hypothetical protein